MRLTTPLYTISLLYYIICFFIFCLISQDSKHALGSPGGERKQYTTNITHVNDDGTIPSKLEHESPKAKLSQTQLTLEVILSVLI